MEFSLHVLHQLTDVPIFHLSLPVSPCLSVLCRAVSPLLSLCFCPASPCFSLFHSLCFILIHSDVFRSVSPFVLRVCLCPAVSL